MTDETKEKNPKTVGELGDLDDDEKARLPPPPQAEKSDGPFGEGETDDDRLATLTRTEEELSTWTTGTEGLLNLALVLRIKHQEAKIRSKRANAGGFWTTLVGVLMACGSVFVLFLGWHRVVYVLAVGAGGVPSPGLWQVGLAATAPVLMMFAFAALLFRVAANFYQRALVHDGEMAGTRNIEAAIRLALGTRDPKVGGTVMATELKAAITKLAERLIQGGAKGPEEPEVPIELVPEVMKLAAEYVEKATKAAKTSG